VLDAGHRHRLNRFDLLVPDGQPVRWALNLLHGCRLRDRVYGPSLMLRICERAAPLGLPVFLYGCREPVLERLAPALRERFPTLRVAGASPSRFRALTAQEKADIVATIRGSGARITFVALGCPRQEVWAYEYREALAMPVVAVGAAFEFLAGTRPQAPAAFQRAGLEWLFRLAHEPRRLWARYLLLNPLYVAMVGAQWAGLHRFDLRATRAPLGELGYG
jgi:exopolysaccharide biosynthesis WecB/TagA/CpsF family protein